MKTLLWLDDIRNPKTADWLIQYAPEYAYDDVNVVWVKDPIEFREWIEKNGVPHTVAFDHDLGVEVSGFDCAKWLVNYCMDNKVDLPKWTVQSANPVGRNNINGIMNNFRKYQLNYPITEE